MTKHEHILSYITALPVGVKISVRSIAKVLEVSEGTAYHAIKDAESKGFVTTIRRFGTIRIDQRRKENFEQITFAEVVKIVDGQVLGGKAGLHKFLGKFLIGAMEIDEMMGYIHPGDLLIVGNRKDAQKSALTNGTAVLITGGFIADKEIQLLADQLELPLIMTAYDTFTVAKMISRAIYDQVIKNDILLVEDVLENTDQDGYLLESDPISKWHEVSIRTQHRQFPVVDNQKKVVGIVSACDILSRPFDATIESRMGKAISVIKKLNLASAAHLMVREDLEMVPVTDVQNQLIGVVRLNLVNNALLKHRERQGVETLEDYVISNLRQEARDHYSIEVVPQIANFQGSISYGAFVSVLSEVASRSFRDLKFADYMIDSMTVYFLKSIPIHAKLDIYANPYDLKNNSGKIDIVARYQGAMVGKALLACRLLEKMKG